MTLLAGLELSLLFVCIWGFIAILITGQFNTLVILGGIAALVIAYRLRRSGWQPSSLVANITAILVFLAAGGIYIGTLNLLIATVYLFLFLQVTKYATRQNLVESRWCYLISLFNVIGASVITTAITFGFILMVYVFLCLISLRLYVTAREWQESLPPDTNSNDLAKNTASTKAKQPEQLESQYASAGPVPRRLLITSSVLTGVILLIASGIFSAIPRLATQNLFQSYGPAQEEPAVSAFSENVEFGSFTEIQLNDAVAMFVQPQGETRPNHVRMRGVALDTFDGKAWSRTGQNSPQNRDFEFRPIFTTRRYSKEHVHRVIQPPGITNFLFGDSFPLSLKVPRAFPFYVDRMAQTAYLQDMPPKEFQYEVRSMHEDLSLRADPTTMDTLYRPASHLTVSRNSYMYSGFYERFSGGEMAEESSSPDGDFRDFTGRDNQSTGTANTEDQPDRDSPEVAEQTDDENSSQPAFLQSDWRNPDDITPEDIEEYRRRRWEARVARYGISEDETLSTSPWAFDPQTTDTEDMNDRRRFRGRFVRRSPQDILNYYLSKCLDLPEELNSGRVASLANQWTNDQETTFAKAMEIERRLRNDFEYSLTPTARGNYIDSFLFDVRAGHCEYFATSMAVLLRNIGIPARVVNGYYSTEWNRLSGMFTVRQRDAHSWIEAWMGDDYGWMTFDPTPPSGVARRGDRSALVDAMSRISDAVRMRWYRYVVDYSFTDQVLAIREVLQWRRDIMDYIRSLNILGISSADERQTEIGDFTQEIDWRPLAIAGTIIFLLLLWQVLRWIGRRKTQRISSIAYYDKLLRQLARHGYSIRPGQTPREFAREVIAEKKQLGEFADVTEHYYATRFTSQSPKPEIMAMVARLRHELRKKTRRTQ